LFDCAVVGDAEFDFDFGVGLFGFAHGRSIEQSLAALE
jgi:hypothetical protein